MLFVSNILCIRRLKFLIFLEVLKLDSGRVLRLLNLFESPS